MSTYVRNGLILFIVLAISVWAIYPPDKKLRLGKDLAGGIALVYNVDVKPGEANVLGEVASVVHDRLDPKGALEIQVQPLGSNRLEITMPLPSDQVKVRT